MRLCVRVEQTLERVCSNLNKAIVNRVEADCVSVHVDAIHRKTADNHTIHDFSVRFTLALTRTLTILAFRLFYELRRRYDRVFSTNK